MEFWALENADDATMVMFGCLIIVGMLIMSGAVLIDWIKKKQKK